MTNITDEKIIGKVGIESVNNYIKVQTLIEILIDKGVFSREEFEDKYKQIDSAKYSEIIEKIFGFTYEEMEKQFKEE